MASFRPRRRTGKNSVTLKVNMGELVATVDKLRVDLYRAVRPAAQAAAEVEYRIVLQNVAAIGKKTGNLASSIYQVFSKEESKPAGDGYSTATYHVSWNARKAPHGHLVEYGHLQRYKVYVGKDGKWYTNKKAPLANPKQVGARPFIRPAFNRQSEAADAAQAKLLEILGAK